MSAKLITPVIDYQQPLPQAVKDKLKPLDTVKILKWNDRTEVTTLHGSQKNGWEKSSALTIGIKTILSNWTFKDSSSSQMVNTGFFSGYDHDMNPRFTPPRFEGGILILNPGKEGDDEIWEKIQIHPHNQNNVVGIRPKSGTFRFHLDDVSAREASELLRIKNVTKAKAAVDALEPDQLALVMKNTGAGTELALQKLAEANPTLVLTSIEQLSIISMRDLVEKCFSPPYSLLVIDQTDNSIKWQEGRQTFFSGGTNTDLAAAFTFYLMGRTDDGTKESTTSKEQKAKLKTLQSRMKQVDDEIEKERLAKIALKKEALAGDTVNVTV